MTLPAFFKREYQQSVSFGTKAQTAYGTALTPATDITHALPLISFKPPKFQTEYWDNTAEIGKGVPDATALDLKCQRTSLVLPCYLTSFLAGWLGYYGLGKGTPTGGADSSYSHLCLRSWPADDGGQLPSASMIYADGLDQKLIRDLVVADWTLAGKPLERPVLTINMNGSGYFANDTTTPLPTLERGSLLKMTDLKFEVGVHGALVDLSKPLLDFNLKWNNALEGDGGYTVGCGLYKSRELYGEHKSYELTCSFERSDSVIPGYLEAATLIEAQLTFTGAAIGSGGVHHKLTIDLPAMKMVSWEPGYSKGIQTIKPKFVPIYDQTNDIIQYTAVNLQAAYLTA